jgi:hypothetical protein
MKQFLKDLFSGNSSVSSMRFCMIISVITACIVAIYATVFNKDLLGTAGLVTALILNTFAKALQKKNEE